jgi:hypothetical protein
MGTEWGQNGDSMGTLWGRYICGTKKRWKHLNEVTLKAQNRYLKAKPVLALSSAKETPPHPFCLGGLDG